MTKLTLKELYKTKPSLFLCDVFYVLTNPYVLMALALVHALYFPFGIIFYIFFVGSIFYIRIKELTQKLSEQISIDALLDSSYQWRAKKKNIAFRIIGISLAIDLATGFLGIIQKLLFMSGVVWLGLFYHH